MGSTCSERIASSRISGFAASALGATRLSATAQNLNSGCCDIGSMASFVTALMQSSSPKTSFQCMGAKQLPARTRLVRTAGSTARPQPVLMSTDVVVLIQLAAASSVEIYPEDAGFSLFSMGTLPVLVMV